MLGATLCLLLSLSGCDSVARIRGSQTVFNGDSALAYARAQVAFGPRVPGTAAHRAAGDWIVTQMKSRADTVEEQRWTHRTLKGDTLPMRNIIARFRPEQTTRVLYVTHWDSRPTADSDRNLGARQRPIDGANDGASGVGLFVALADAFKKTPPTVGVDLVFVDGEDYGAFDGADESTRNKDVLIGSQYFADRLPATYKPIFGVVWDMIGDKFLNIRQEGHSISGAPEVVTRVWSVAKELGYGKYFVDESQSGITDDHLPLLRKGLRVIDVIDINYCSNDDPNCTSSSPTNLHHTTSDTMEHISARSLKIVGDVALTLVTR